MRYSGTRLIHEAELGTALAPIKNRPGYYIRLEWNDAQCLKPYELFEQGDGSIKAQNVLGKKFPLERLIQSTWIRVGFENRI